MTVSLPLDPVILYHELSVPMQWNGADKAQLGRILITNYVID